MQLVTSWDLPAARRLRDRVAARGWVITLPFVDRLIEAAEEAIAERALMPVNPEARPAPDLTPRQEMVLGDIDYELRREARDGPLSTKEDARSREIMRAWAQADAANHIVYDWTAYRTALEAERNKPDPTCRRPNGDRVRASRRMAATNRWKRRAALEGAGS